MYGSSSFSALIPILVFVSLLLLNSGTRKLHNLFLPFVFLNISTWFLARYCNSINIAYEVDIFTAYFFVWQLICLIYKWIHQDLPYFRYCLHQMASCFYTAFLAFILHDVVIRYLGTITSFAIVWIMSILDM